jgi:MFS family permease
MAPAARRLGPERMVLAATATTMILLVLDSSIVGVMLPSISHDLALTTSESSWLVTSYLLALAVLLPLGGRVSDAIARGRRSGSGWAHLRSHRQELRSRKPSPGSLASAVRCC